MVEKLTGETTRRRRRVGLIINPIAGMGGSVGLKGTDGDMFAKALELGAQPVSPERTREFLKHLKSSDEVRWLVAPGAMGADYATEVGIAFDAVGDLRGDPGPEDTRSIAADMLTAGADAIVFAGGDGTARDLADAGPKDAAVVFDFVRYRRATIGAAETLASLGTPIVAITDGPLSPLASLTEHWCQVTIPAVGPFDSSVPAVAAAELLVSQVTRDLKDAARDRIDRTEALWDATGTFCPGG